MLALIILSTLAAGMALGRALDGWRAHQARRAQEHEQEVKARIDARVAAIRSQPTPNRVSRAA